MARKVTYLKAHTSLFIPALGTLGDTLPPSMKNIPGLSMEEHPSGVAVTAAALKGDFVLVPYGNIAAVRMTPEPATEEKSSKR